MSPYPNAPIREAVFDISIDALDVNDVSVLEGFREDVLVYFPKLRIRHRVSGSVALKDDGEAVHSRTTRSLLGFLFENETGNRQVQARLNGFTFNVLNPYATWEDHFDTFISLWQSYRDKYKPHKITRIATRFINRIELPIDAQFDKYVKYVPPIPQCLSQEYHNFFMQIHVPCGDKLRNAIITETIEQPVKETIPIILDIDVFQSERIKSDIEGITAQFNQIRDWKNRIFEDCITDNTRSLFK